MFTLIGGLNNKYSTYNITRLTIFTQNFFASSHSGYLGSLVVRVLGSRLDGREFDSRPPCCRVKTVGKLFIPCLSPSSINWYRCESQSVNRLTTQCISIVSMLSQHKLFSG